MLICKMGIIVALYLLQRVEESKEILGGKSFALC